MDISPTQKRLRQPFTNVPFVLKLYVVEGQQYHNGFGIPAQ